VGVVQHEVVLKSDIQSLDLLRCSTKTTDGRVNGVLTGHELFVLSMDFVDDAIGVDAVLVSLPVDWGVILDVLLDVVIIEQRLELTVSLTRVVGGGSLLKSAQPVGSQVVVVRTGMYGNCSLWWRASRGLHS
jgi:hypothetical protein